MIDFVINEKAGGKKALRAKKNIIEILDKKGIAYRFHSTNHPKHAIELTKDLCAQGAKTIVAVGGDGTINEVLNGLDDLSVNFGIIPCGSGNDFAFSANIPLKTELALDLILNGSTKPTDFLVCDGVRGINIIGTGIDVDILARCEKNKMLKGKLKYFVSLLVSLINFKFYGFRLGKSDAPPRSGMIICCCNGKKFSGGISMCPVAEIADGKMDFIIVNKLNRLKIPYYLIKLIQGKVLDLKFCEHTLEDQAKILFEKPVTVEIDGELYENLNYDIHIEKAKLNLYRP